MLSQVVVVLCMPMAAWYNQQWLPAGSISTSRAMKCNATSCPSWSLLRSSGYLNLHTHRLCMGCTIRQLHYNIQSCVSKHLPRAGDYDVQSAGDLCHPGAAQHLPVSFGIPILPVKSTAFTFTPLHLPAIFPFMQDLLQQLQLGFTFCLKCKHIPTHSAPKVLEFLGQRPLNKRMCGGLIPT